MLHFTTSEMLRVWLELSTEQLFHRNFFLDKSLWTTIFPDKMLS